MKLTRLAAALSLGAVLVAGCGGDDPLSKADYEELVQTEYADVQAAFRATGASYGRPDLAEKIEAAQRELREAADALDEAEPPEEVVAENDQVVGGMRRYS